MTPKIAGLALGAVVVAFLRLPAFAQSTEWEVDSRHSRARIAITADSSGRGGAITLGAAIARGTLRLDNNDPSRSSFQFDLYPAGAGPAFAQWNADQGGADGGPSPRLSFRSETVSPAADGMLNVSGDLTLIRIVRDLESVANEGYSGASEVKRTVLRTTHKRSFLLPIPAAPAGAVQDHAYQEVSASLEIKREEFPELVNVVLSTNWHPVGQDPVCVDSPHIGERDYRGTICTGSAVETASATRDPDGSTIFAEPANLVILTLHLRLEQKGDPLAAKFGRGHSPVNSSLP